MPFDEAQRIAESQLTWEILFIILFIVVGLLGPHI